MDVMIEQYNDICEFNKTGWCQFNVQASIVYLDNYIRKVFHINKEKVSLDAFTKLILPLEQSFFRIALKLFIHNKQEFKHYIHFYVNKQTIPAFFTLKKATIDADGKIATATGIIKISPEAKDFSGPVLNSKLQNTYQKEMESLLSENNLKIHMACKAASIYPWTCNFKDHAIEVTFVDDNNIVTKKIENERFIALIHEEDQSPCLTVWNDFMQGKTDSIRICFRTKYFKKKLVWYELLGNVYTLNNNSEQEKAVGILRDITEHKLHEEILSESDKMKSAFLANMSHEIRTPLNAIIGFSSLICQTQDQQEKNEYVKIIESNNKLLLQLVSDILDIAKLEGGRFQFRFCEFNLNDMFNYQQLIFQKQANPNINIVFEKREEEWIIMSDQLRVTQALSNFLSNAVKFTKKGEIRMGYKPTETGIYIYVSDTGCGIPQQMQSFIFDRFAKASDFSQGGRAGTFHL